MSPRPPTPPDQALSIMSPPLPPVVKEEEKSYIVDGICLSEDGLSQVKEYAIEAPPTLTPAQKAASQARKKNRQQMIKQSHPQMSHLLSTSSSCKC